MAPLDLTYACEDYDLQRAIIDASVQPAGARLRTFHVQSEDRHDRMARGGDFDLAEFSMSVYLTGIEQGLPLVGLPIFPRRMFVHRFLFVRSDSGIDRPEQLAGRRVGIMRHQNTLSLIGRGLLHDDFGLDLESVTWVTQRAETIAFGQGPTRTSFEAAPEGSTLEQLLLDGQIDALMIPGTISACDRQDARVRRLFPDFRAAEADHFRRTGIFPIMHLIVARRDLIEREPWLVQALMDAFAESQRRAFDWLAEPATVSLAWARALFEEERAFFGGHPWPIGTRANAVVLEAMARWSHLLGLTSRQITLSEPFPGIE